jgi:hypothetical protein
MRIFASQQGDEPEAKPKLLLRIRQRGCGVKRPFAARVLFFNGLLNYSPKGVAR